MKEKIKEFLLSNWTLSEKVLLITDVLLLGVVIGWITSPKKNKIVWGTPFVDGPDDILAEADSEEI